MPSSAKDLVKSSTFRTEQGERISLCLKSSSVEDMDNIAKVVGRYDETKII